MNSYKEKVDAFIKCKSIAVTGVSRSSGSSVGNPIYKRFKSEGYETYQVNPNADTIDGDKCYPNLKAISQKVDAVMICTNSKDSISVVKECKELGIDKVWFHNSMGPGSYSKEAAEFCKENGITAIETGCPMMHVGNVDFGHKCIHFFLNVFGKLKN